MMCKRHGSLRVYAGRTLHILLRLVRKANRFSHRHQVWQLAYGGIHVIHHLRQHLVRRGWLRCGVRGNLRRAADRETPPNRPGSANCSRDLSPGRSAFSCASLTVFSRSLSSRPESCRATSASGRLRAVASACSSCATVTLATGAAFAAFGVMNSCEFMGAGTATGLARSCRLLVQMAPQAGHSSRDALRSKTGSLPYRCFREPFCRNDRLSMNWECLPSHWWFQAKEVGIGLTWL